MAALKYAGAAVPTNALATSMSAGSPTVGGTFNGSDATGFPTGGEFVVKISNGVTSEKVLVTRSGNTFTVVSRGYDNTTAISHSTADAYITHVFDATSAQRWEDAVVTTLPALTTTVAAKVAKATVPFELIVAISDETTAITTGNAKITFRAPFAMTLTAVRASVNTASSSGTPTIDINDSGTTILSTKITIDANEKTSTTAAIPPVLSDTSIADDAEITVDIDVAGTGAKGLKVAFIGTRVQA